MKLKYIKHLALCLVLTLALTVGASASPVPGNLVVENLNGQQHMVKTYALPPNADPETLKNPSFEYGGYIYTWTYATKDEHTFLETKNVTETVTVETEKMISILCWSSWPPAAPTTTGNFPVSWP